MKLITPPEVHARVARGEALVFVDARDPKAWEESHRKIQGAVRILPAEVDGHERELPRGLPIIAYCTDPGERASSKVAQRLGELGFEETYVLQGGFDAWEEAGYPVTPKEEIPAHAGP